MGAGAIAGNRIGTERGLVMRKTCIAFGILSAGICLAWSMGIAAPAIAAEILIGMSAPITGGWAAEADLYVKAIKLAEKQINEAGGVNGKKIRMVITDNQSTNPGALVFVGQLGATRSPNGYAHFASEQLGWKALDRDIEAKFALIENRYVSWAAVEKVLRMRAGTDTDVELYVRLIVDRLRARGVKP